MSSRKRRSQRGVEVSATHTCYYEEEQNKMQGPNWRDASGDRERGHTMQWHLQAIYTTFRGEGGQDGYDWNTVTPASNDTTCLEGVITDRRLHDTATPANRSDTSLGVSTDRRLHDTTIHATNRSDKPWSQHWQWGDYTIPTPANRYDTSLERVGWVLLYVHRNRRLIRDGSPERPPRLSHSSWDLIERVSRLTGDYTIQQHLLTAVIQPLSQHWHETTRHSNTC